MRKGTTLNDLMQWDNTLFNDITLNSDIDHDTLVSTIMLRCGLQNPLYEDWDVMRSQILVWFAAHEWNFDKLVRLIKEEYNPLWNIDRYEEIDAVRTDNEKENTGIDGSYKNGGTVNNKTTESGATTVSDGGKETATTTLGETLNATDNKTTTRDHNKTDNWTETTSDNATDIKSVKAFNETAWMETDKNEHTETGSRTHNGTETNDETITENGTHNETKGGENKTETDFGRTETTDHGRIEDATQTIDTNGTTETNTARSLDGSHKDEALNHYYGNGGVTMSQQMFLAETSLLNGFNLYQWISDKFSKELMVGVYIY